MNVYEVRQFFDTGPAYIAAVSFEEVATMLGGNALSISYLGALSFQGGAEAAKALTGGRQVTLDEAKASITDSHLISFEDNRPYKSLTRHLKAYGLTFEQYKAKWGLPSQYPAIHPSYSIKRRDLALAAGLGLGKGNKK